MNGEVKIKKNFSLKKYNTMRVESITDYFLEVKEERDIIEGLRYAREKEIPFFILGKGSNVILPKFYHGIVLFVGIKKMKIDEKKDNIELFAESGAYLPDVSLEVSKRKGSGIEWAGGVPGTVGGAVRGNAGAFGDFIADYLKEVEALNTSSVEKEIFEKNECFFGYRESIFKKRKDIFILNVKMIFPKKNDSKKKYKKYLNYRKENHPEEFSAGSVFKNPQVEGSFYKLYPELEKFQSLGFIPIRVLVEKAGLKGKKIGGAQVSLKHANFIINTGNATQEDIKGLIFLIKKKIKENFGIEVEEEVEIVE